MKILKFNLSGDFAFFKNESINDMYETYPHIHKPALLGMFGAILGYDGYAQTQKIFNKTDEENIFPEYYKKLKDIKVGIVPKEYSFPKIIENFNNSTGMFNRVADTRNGGKNGTNLIVEQVWLEKPSWDIYLIVDNPESEKIMDSIINSKSVYHLYLGINNHFADISDINVYEGIENKEKAIIINSIVKENEIKEIKGRVENEIMEIDFVLPFELSPRTNIYVKEFCKLTNSKVELVNQKAYKVDNKNVVFY